jgi:hypothetical protein
MTPQEIFDYKVKWLQQTVNASQVHSDLEWEAKQWCKKNLEQHQWDFSKYTDVYEDTFRFETKEIKDLFDAALENRFE